MSAFMVTTDTMSRAIGGLQALAKDHSAREMFQGMHVYQDATKLGKALFELNARACNGRYACNDYKPPVFKFNPIKVGSKLTGLQALNTLIYQCSEDATVEDPLYMQLVFARGELANRIVCELPEYQALPWGG